jgi:nitrate reductase assembly molybdenum cofactor insertion protein NarJ
MTEERPEYDGVPYEPVPLDAMASVDALYLHEVLTRIADALETLAKCVARDSFGCFYIRGDS